MAPDEYTKFRAVGAVITKVNSVDSCMVAFMLESSQPLDLSDEKRWVRVDFLRTPSRARIWSDVWFDDRGINEDGDPVSTVSAPRDIEYTAVTSIGPLADLPRGQYLGAVYLRNDKLKEWSGLIADPRGKLQWKPNDWFHYEVTSIACEKDAGGQDHRYHGFEGEVKSLNGSVAQVKLYNSVNRTTPFKTVEIDLADRNHCLLDVRPDLTTPKNWFDPEDASDTSGAREAMLKQVVGSRGGIYINLKLGAELFIIGPKLPIGEGQDKVSENRVVRRKPKAADR